ILLHNFVPLAPHGVLADATRPAAQRYLVARMNERLAERAEALADTFVVDVEAAAAKVGHAAFFDARMFGLSRMPMSAAGQAELAALHARYLRARAFGPAKCLVLDLDNTLWGGILGEDGPGGIKLGDDHPGLAYKQLQRACLRVASRGVMLAVASKNNKDEAM